jgi:hypothetical protein
METKHPVQQSLKVTAALAAALGSSLHIAEIQYSSSTTDKLPALTVHAHSAQEVERVGEVAEQHGFRTLLSRTDPEGLCELKLVPIGGSGGSSGPTIPGLPTCPGLVPPRPWLSLISFEDVTHAVSRRVNRWWRV